MEAGIAFIYPAVMNSITHIKGLSVMLCTAKKDSFYSPDVMLTRSLCYQWSLRVRRCREEPTIAGVCGMGQDLI